ncbi:MAG: putative bifunctional diguanylate cyclase/phosphodiesterase [Pyrinomonadaceae bacterium]
MNRPAYLKQYRALIAVLGALVSCFSIAYLPVARLDWRFFVLALITVVISSRAAIKLPRVNINITVSDTFIFLTVLLYGGEAAILLAAAEGLISGSRISKTPLVVLFNAGVMACATFVTVWTLRFVFGGTELPSGSFALTAVVICLMALVQCIANTGILAVCMACKIDRPVWATWKEHYLWTLISFFAGATAAAFIYKSFDTIGFYAIIGAVPIISIVYFTYHKYLEDIRATSAIAEQAERARREQAERHVGELNSYIEEQRRISQALQESKEKFRHAAFHDALTGLPNRVLLTDHLKLAIERARRREDHLFAVLFLDLDRFKNINDSLGHNIGDQLLIAIARRVENCLRPMDTVARLGGDEFAILLDGLENSEAAVHIAERIQESLTQPYNLSGHEVYTSTSIGITLSTTNYEHPENLLRDADTAMYRAKENGKARYELFDTVMHARAVALLKLENDLRRAVERQEFEVYYQPIIRLETSEISGFEALLRWNHPERGFVSPTEFIPLAEETGLITEIGQWVLRKACEQMQEWQWLVPATRPLTVAVNLSSKQFKQSDIIEQIKKTLRETNCDPRSLKLEITESAVMENAEAATQMLTQLRDLGVQLSIDDFGTGYSSLSYLHRFPVTTLKIDRSFIGRMGAGDENSEIVRTIMTLAGNLGMDVVAEGVETEEQLTQLTALKCEYGQGYLFSKPVDAAAAQELLRQRAQGRAKASYLVNEPTIFAPDIVVTPHIN